MKVWVVMFAALINLPLQQPAPQAPARPPDCKGQEHRQFDFWLGTWTVTVTGKPAGTNRIESAQSGCVLIEHWSGARGGKGTSLNFYNRATKQWHQTWISSTGGALLLSGGLRDGAMVLQSEPLTQPAGGTIVHRITWSRLENGNVRQHWESSTDDGKTWTSAFDGLYVKSMGTP